MYEVGTPYADAEAALDKHRATFSVFPGDSMDYDKIVAWRYTPFGQRAQ